MSDELISLQNNRISKLEKQLEEDLDDFEDIIYRQ